MPERARLAEREQEDVLGRSPRAVDSGSAAPAFDDAAALRHVRAGIGHGPTGSGGFPRGMGPATVIAMQRLAGNRATVQALGRRPTSGSLDTPKPRDEEEAIAGGAVSGAALASPRLGDVAAGPPGAGGPPGGGGPPAGGGPPGNGDGAGKSNETATAKPGVLGSAGGPSANLKSGETATATPRTPRRTPPPPIVSGGDAKASETATSTMGAARMSGPTLANRKPGAGPAPAANAPAPAPGQGTPEQLGPAPAPAPAPGTVPAAVVPVATGPGGLPAPETASTGIDWNYMLSEFGPPVRTVLEVTRLIPGWGLVGGLAADSINFASDLAAIPNSENADLATGLIVFRNFVNIGNNGLGHVLYVNQLIQDALAASVVAAEFTPITAAINTAGATVKVVLDEVQMGTDIVVEVESIYEANHAPSSAEAEQWRSLADGYAANILGDVVNVVLDVISLSSAGAANTAPVQQARQPLTLASIFMKNAAQSIPSAVNGVLGVWLGSLLTKGRQAYVGSPTELRDQALALDAAGFIVDTEGLRARTAYSAINVVIDALSASADLQIAQINAVAEALSGGKSAFQLIRDAVQAGLEDMHRKLGMVEQLGASASNAQANAASISAACASVLGALDALVMPQVTLPSVDLGDGGMADAAEAAINSAAELANDAIREAMSSVAAAIETAKDGIRGPVEALQERADGLGEWLALLATECTAMVGTLNGQIALFSEGLGSCTSVEQVIDLIIGQVSDLTGMPRVTVQEIRDAWTSVGSYIDQFVALGPRMHQRATDLRAQADLLEEGGGGGPTFALPPGPPPGTPPGTPPNPNADTASLAAVA